MAKKIEMKDLEIKMSLLKRELFKRELTFKMYQNDENKNALKKINELVNSIGEQMVKLEMEDMENGKRNN